MSGAGHDGMTLGEPRGVGGAAWVSSCLLCTVCVPVLFEGFLPWQLASVACFLPNNIFSLTIFFTISAGMLSLSSLRKTTSRDPATTGMTQAKAGGVNKRCTRSRIRRAIKS